ncbi:FAD/NAD(P)-binding protein [Noviherbaspirillum autotrophicum]|uniref:Ni/Fe hydrogenase subunit gamma n=1 Tax=Noviherbaspirillum autotrophicum TaxID=709839 RepID=A0A0C1YLN4_9BURK|nr:FAD/NAD(P)-binding protein [Noviherbaspirillum autotrophicum]KIF81382.1 Ni/Fe hydrogenase subunit gamma [Noviherbaspirillum autotrophicum]
MNPYLPLEAQIIARVQESKSVFTLRLQLTDEAARQGYRFEPGQFNMLYLYGAGEVPISIVSDPQDAAVLEHTVRVVGRVTRTLAELQPGDRIGLRGPYGRGWPLLQAEGHDVLIITGGLGCAPVVSVINYVLRRRRAFGRLTIIQGVKHAEDLLWRDRYAYWATLPDTQVLLAADHGGPLWPWHVGVVTEVFDDARIAPERTVAMMCGPEGMMRAAVKNLAGRGVAPERIYVNMERNMQCAVGHCGHCQYGGAFVCRQGPVFAYPQVRALFDVRGF